MSFKNLKFVGPLLLFTFGIVVGALIFAKVHALKEKSHRVLATIDGVDITNEQVVARVGGDLRLLERNIFEVKRRAILDVVKESRRVPNEKTASLSTVSPDELKKYLSDRKMSLKALSPKDIAKIESSIRRERQQLLDQSRAEEETLKHSIVWKLPVPSLAHVEAKGGVVRSIGPFFAPVEVVVSSNYHCPSCKEGAARISALRQQYLGRLKLQFRFAMRDGPESIVFQTALAAICADDQSKFEEFHKRVSEQPPLSELELIDAISKSNLDAEKMSNCRKAKKKSDALISEISDSRRELPFDVPIIVVNGDVVSPLEQTEFLQSLIESKLL